MDEMPDVDQNQTVALVENFLLGRGMRLTTSALAEIGSIVITGARVQDAEGRPVAWGLSRATGALSRTVAAAEAVEHLLASGLCPDLLGPVLTVDGSDVGPVGDSVHNDRLMAWIRARAADLSIECRRYVRVGGLGPDEAYLPRFLVEMNYWRESRLDDSIRSFARYGNTTGWSIATDRPTARERSVLEVLERDVVSRFMLSVYLGRRYPCSYVALESMAAATRRTAADAGRWLGHEVVVLALTPPDSVVTVCLASAVDGRSWGRIVGKGADLDPDTACQRAVAELCQIHAVDRLSWLDIDEDGATQRFQRVHPRGMPVYDLRICPGEIGYDVPTWSDRRQAEVSPSDWYDQLARTSTRPFYVLDAELVDGALHCCSAYVPGADRFFLTGHGIEVAPTGHDPLRPGVLDMVPEPIG